MRKIKLIKQLVDECPICEAERELEYALFEEKLNVRGEDIKVKARAYYCPVGKHYFSDLEDDEEKVQYAYREYRKRKGLLQPEEIKEIRTMYDLSLREFSEIVEISYVTLQRYESGALQEGPNNILLKCMKDPLNFEKEFNDKKAQLSAKLIKKVESRLRKLLVRSCQLTLDFAIDIDLAMSILDKEINKGNKSEAKGLSLREKSKHDYFDMLGKYLSSGQDKYHSAYEELLRAA